MQALEVTLLPDHSKLSLVAKLPPVSQFLKDFSNFGLSLKKEITIYQDVAKAFRDLHLENNVPEAQVTEFFPRCYGARVLYVDGEPVADKSGLLMENLVTLGYRCGDRIAGLDLSHAELVVSRLGRFHATAIAVRIKKPQVFRDTILPACKPMRPKGPLLGGFKIEDHILQQLGNIKDCGEYMGMLKKFLSLKPESDPREPFVSINHNDFWTNNMMFKYNQENGEELPLDVRFVDFQLCWYESSVRDLLFFLFTSTKPDIVAEHLDRLILLYHEKFEDQLKRLGCDKEPFSFDAFQKEVEEEAPKELLHIIMMMNLIMKDKSKALNIDEIKGEGDMMKGLLEPMSRDCEKRVTQIIKQYVNKGSLS